MAPSGDLPDRRMSGDLGRYLIAAAQMIALGLLRGYRPAGRTIGLLAAINPLSHRERQIP
jgi:hypothetical protein